MTTEVDHDQINAGYAAAKTETLLEDLGRLQRYRARSERAFGKATVAARLAALKRILDERGVTGDRLPPEAPPPPPFRFEPLADHVCIRPATPAEMTAGGLVIVDSAKEKPMQGEVLATGPGAMVSGVGLVPVRVKVGDTVLFGRYAGTEVTIDDEPLLIIRADDLLGRLADPPAPVPA